MLFQGICLPGYVGANCEFTDDKTPTISKFLIDYSLYLTDLWNYIF